MGQEGSEKMEEFIGEFIVACSFRSVRWIHGPNVDNIKHLQQELARVHSLWELPLCLGGDFNVIRFSIDCSRISKLGPAMTTFFEQIFDLSQWTSLSWGELSRGLDWTEYWSHGMRILLSKCEAKEVALLLPITFLFYQIAMVCKEDVAL